MSLWSCGISEPQPKAAEEVLQQPAPRLEKTNFEKLELEVSKLRGGNFIKDIQLEDGAAKLKYAADYDEYKQWKPESSLTKAEVEAYWESGDAVNKALVDGPARLLRKLIL